MTERPEETNNRPGLFEAFGVELEYMIVDAETLDVLPIADQLLKDADGTIRSDVDCGRISWSNELTLHVVELKTTAPEKNTTGLQNLFHEQIQILNRRAADLNARLLPTAMHPWMDPLKEMKLWPHDSSPVYAAFDRIFDCRGHGWANLQSVHLNLPFRNDAEFGQLHAAVRLILPLLPALAASSPVTDCRITGFVDNRLEVYRSNSRRIPLAAGRVIPEPAFTRDDYNTRILQPLYAQIAPLDPDGILQDEFLNARGAIARFERGSVEIRVLDIQECPAADLAVLQLIIAAVRALTEERWSTSRDQRIADTDLLYNQFHRCVRDGEQALIEYPRLLSLFGRNPEAPLTAQKFWEELAAELSPALEEECSAALQLTLKEGPLSRRILRRIENESGATDQPIPTEVLRDIWGTLAECLRSNTPFT